MSTIVTRSGKGSPLTHVEVDANFTNLNSDKYQSGDAATFTTLTATGQTSLGGSAGSEGLRVTTTASGVNWVQIAGSASSGFSNIIGAAGTSTDIQMLYHTKGTYGHVFRTNGSAGPTQFFIAHTASAVNNVQVTGAATGGTPIILAQGSDTNIGLIYNAKGTSAHSFNGNGGTHFQVTSVASGANFLRATGATATAAPVLSSQGSDTNIDINLTTKGTGAVRFNTGGGEQVRVADTASAVNYWVISGNSAGNSGTLGMAGTSTNVGTYFYTKGSAAHQFLTNSNAEQFRIAHTASAVNYLQATGAAAGGSPYFITAGSDTNINFTVASKGSGTFAVTTNGGAQLQFNVSHTANAVNYVQVTGGATGVQPIISAQGSDANIAMTIRSKGTFACEFQSSSGTNLFQALPVASSVNFLRASPAVAGSGPELSAQGSDTNIDLALTPKGTGLVRFGTYTAGAPTATGYISIKAADGTTYKILVGT